MYNLKKIREQLKGFLKRRIRMRNVFKGWRITQYFGWTDYAKQLKKDGKKWYRYGQHTGIDYAAFIGTPIYAPHQGHVVKIHTVDDTGTGISLSLWDDCQEIATRYYHMNQVCVKVNDKIKIGQLIGYVGSTGLSTGPHLHFELLRTKNGFVIDKDNGAGGAIDPLDNTYVRWVG